MACEVQNYLVPASLCNLSLSLPLVQALCCFSNMLTAFLLLKLLLMLSFCLECFPPTLGKANQLLVFLLIFTITSAQRPALFILPNTGVSAPTQKLSVVTLCLQGPQSIRLKALKKDSLSE